jgi:hypothetical protein
MTEAFNPLAMNNLAHSIVTRMLETDPTPLDAVPRFRRRRSDNYDPGKGRPAGERSRLS